MMRGTNSPALVQLAMTFISRLGVSCLSKRSAVSHARLSRWRTTMSVIEIPAGKNVQMKARLILPEDRKIKGLG